MAARDGDTLLVEMGLGGKVVGFRVGLFFSPMPIRVNWNNRTAG